MNMYDQIERELKVLITKDEYETLLRSYDFGKPVIQKNVYFDDDKGSVRQLGALRIRTVNGKRILTLKIRKDSITQTELEKETDTENISAITDSEIRNWFALYQIPDALHRFASSETVRRIAELPNAELCLDISRFGNHTDYEIEYEYKKDHDGIHCFNEILSRVGLVYEKNAPSKLARAVQYSSDQNL